jgi:hypothetical protein
MYAALLNIKAEAVLMHFSVLSCHSTEMSSNPEQLKVR